MRHNHANSSPCCADLVSNPYGVCSADAPTLCIGIDQCEVDVLASAAAELRRTIAAAVKKVSRVSLGPVAPNFAGKACQGTPEQINCVEADPQTIFVPPDGIYLDSALTESFHPNALGQGAYFDAVQSKV